MQLPLPKDNLLFPKTFQCGREPDNGERESLREVRLHHVAAFGSVFSTQEQVKLSYVKYLPIPQNDLVSFGQTQPR